jgi:hypothetical protein
VVIKRSFRISAAVGLAALAVLVGAQYGHVGSRHVEADTTWSVPANAVAIEHAARPADTTW